MRVIATICARGGSKGVPGKNIRQLAGLPLIAHSIRQALECNIFAAVAVSSDSEEVLSVASTHGATHVVTRPHELASDGAAKIPAIRHCVMQVEETLGICDVVIDLDATSPLRNIADIQQAYDLLMNTGCPNVITGCRSRRSPYFNMVEIDGDGNLALAKQPGQDVHRRQDAPRTFDMNASIYVWRRDALFGSDSVISPATRLHEMPESRSLDIDTELDFELVEYLLLRQAT